MPRIAQLEPDNAPPQTRELYKNVQAAHGHVPNILKVLGNSQETLKGYMDLHSTLANVSLGHKMAMTIMLAVSELNGCVYSLSSYSEYCLKTGLLTEEKVIHARRLIGVGEKTTDMLEFTAAVVRNKGHVKPADMDLVRGAGWTDKEIVECLGLIALATYENYIGNVSLPELDIPEADAIEILDK